MSLKSIKNIRSAIGRHRVELLVLLAAAVYYPRFIKLPAGMETYPQAAACLWKGEMLQVCDPGFTYPPFFALITLPFAPMPMWLRDPVWYVLTLAATAGAFKISEFVAGKAVATPLERAELSPNHTPKMIVMSVARDHCIERGWIDPYDCHVIVEDLGRESEVD